MLLLVGLLGTFVFAEKNITIFVDGEVREVMTSKLTVSQLLNEQGIILSEEDILLPTEQGRLQDNMNLTIIRGKPTLLMVDGEIREILIPVPDVMQILSQEGIELGPQDKVEAVLWPQGDVDESFIKVTRITEELIIEEEEVDYQLNRQPDYRLPEGRQQIIDAGEPGLIRRQVVVTFEDNQEVTREVLEEELVKEPKQGLVVYGTAKHNMIASRGGYHNLREDEVRQVLSSAVQVQEMEATAYTHTGNPTFSGIMPYVGVVAVDPAVIPLGTKMYIEGYGFGLAADTGGVIKGNIIDLFMDSREEALRWGRRQVRVHILE